MRTSRVVTAGATAGALGALVMIVAQAMARLGAGIPMFPDLLEDLATRLIPPELFARVLDALKFEAKYLLFVGLLVAQVVVGALVGLLFAAVWGRDLDPGRQQWAGWNGGLLGAVALWLLTGLVVLPIAGQGFFGSATAVGPLALNLALLVSWLLFGITTAGSYRVLGPRGRPAPGPVPTASEAVATSPERRRLLGGLAIGTVAVLAAGASYRVLSVSAPGVGAVPSPSAEPAASPTAVTTSADTPAATPTGGSRANEAPPAPSATALATPVASPEWQIAGLVSEITSTKDFYTVSKNFFSDPVVDPKSWSLQITGLVKKPYSLSYDQLLKLPAIERYQTLECISNEIGGNLISNASWRGVSLRDLIQAAEPDPSAIKVVFSAADGYTDSLPLARALSPANLLAHTMNGEPLAAAHGRPARLLIPGIYGMKNVKWLTKIELVSANYLGYWQQRGWSDDAFINTMSRIDVPLDNGQIKPGPVTLAGIAFGGDKGISKVEVSVDGGKTWLPATLKPPLGDYTWRLWRLDWNAASGNYTIVVRATNGAGEVQTATVTDTLPNGATGWHTVSVQVGSR